MREAFSQRKLLYGGITLGAIGLFVLSLLTLSIHHLYPGLSLSESNFRNGVSLFVIGCVIVYALVFELVMDAEVRRSSRVKALVLIKRWFYLTLWFLMLGMSFAAFSEDPRKLWYDLNNLFG